MPTARVVLADDDFLFREGLAVLLERASFEIVGRAGDANGLLQLARQERPDVVIVDVRMPPTHTTEGLEAARQIRAELPEIAILVLSAHIEVEHAMELLGGGRGIGYVLKTRVIEVDDFMRTLERVVAGGAVVDSGLVERLVTARRVHDPLASLTAREREVLTLMAGGRTNGGIARQLWITDGTVEKHVKSIFGKLRLPETADDHRRVLAVIAFLEFS
jgi:DNA-binding NarL/FixJ family response regulator